MRKAFSTKEKNSIINSKLNNRDDFIVSANIVIYIYIN